MVTALVGSVVLRPTLMFGWFDRKHFGWLSRFMKRCPIFPVPGNGKYLRQPLFALDFCDIIIGCIERPGTEGIFNITGLQKIDYIDIIREIRRITGARTLIVTVPYAFFALLLGIYALFDRDPPFTVSQLKALVTPDEFEVIDWPKLFGVRPTPLHRALELTFNHPVYSRAVLRF